MASNEGATYDFPMIIGSDNTTQIKTLTYQESEGRLPTYVKKLLIHTFTNVYKL